MLAEARNNMTLSLGPKAAYDVDAAFDARNYQCVGKLSGRGNESSAFGAQISTSTPWVEMSQR